MRFEQLEYFDSLISLKTIQAVSEKFYTSPQVVSKAIKQLEDELNTTLFSRTRRGLTLTEDGFELQLHVEEILSHYQSIRKTFIEKNSQPQIQDLKILTAKGTVSYFSDLMKNMDTYSESKCLNFIMNTTTVSEIWKLLYTKNHYDIISTVLTDDNFELLMNETFIAKNYAVFVTYREKLKLWVNKNSSFAAKGKISYKDLKKVPLIRYNLEELSFDNFLKHNYNVKLSYSYQFTELSLAYDMLKKNVGGFFAPDITVQQTCPVSLFKDIVGLDLDVDFFQVSVILVNKKKLEDPAFAALIKEWKIQNVC